eukprot:13502633-Alexandrium_andersonii.AAC.1
MATMRTSSLDCPRRSHGVSGSPFRQRRVVRPGMRRAVLWLSPSMMSRSCTGWLPGPARGRP